jgi:ComF family protein
MIEKLMEFIAPDECLNCGKEGVCLCDECKSLVLTNKKPACAICNRLDERGKTCSSCYAKSKLSGASIAFRYEGVAKDIVKGLKFENKRSYARFLSRQLPRLDADIVCFVPSDGKTRRSRGYDQAEMLAKNYSKYNHLEFKKVLIRNSHTRQVGLNRNQRIQNIKDNFVVNYNVAGKSLLPVDDVITTGATISECARVLKDAGAKNVWALAVAKG